MSYENLIVVAILAKDKEATLPLYLKTIEAQTYPKKKIAIWIRSNNNKDKTASILEEWAKRVEKLYHSVKIDLSDVEEKVENYEPHEWNTIRFKVLGSIRQASVDYALSLKAHYFVADCDNFILPDVLENLFSVNLPVVSPMLRKECDGSLYANYHSSIDENGYFADDETYLLILGRKIKGLLEVPVIHCTYFVRKEVLPYVSYDDDSQRYEYVIFSNSLRNSGINQYLDNRKDNGFLSFANTKEELMKEPRWKEFNLKFSRTSFYSDDDNLVSSPKSEKISLVD